MKEKEIVPGVEAAIPVPDSLFEALEYDGDARFVAVYWSPAGDEAELTDGLVSGTSNWRAFLTYMEHPVVQDGFRRSAVDPSTFGNSESMATHWLVLDRRDHKAYDVAAEAAEEFLREQHGERPAFELTPEAIMQAIAQAIEQTHDPTMGEIEDEIRKEQERVRKLKADLDSAALSHSEDVGSALSKPVVTP